MAKPYGVEVGVKEPVEGTFAATGQSGSFQPLTTRAFNIALTGTAVATVQLEKSFDGGATWCEIHAGGTQLYEWSYAGTNLTEGCEESEAGVLYRLNCTAYTSGTLTYRLSQ